MPCESPLPLPLIDIFAGPGGLGEGFASYRVGNRRAYQLALSIEKDAAAHRTLKLRAFFRQFPDGKAPEDYYRYLKSEVSLDQLYARHPSQHAAADGEAWQAELGKSQLNTVRKRILSALERTGASDRWALLGGPPCQPFSLAGRSRNKANTQYSGAKETRHELYIEYLQIIADFWPVVFVMENVRGLLSATFNGQQMFNRITSDLEHPAEAIRSIPGRGLRNHQIRHQYRLYSLNPAADSNHLFVEAPDYLVRCENHGIPQARHRLILIGVRDDILATPGTLSPAPQVPACDVLDGLPPLRSGLSPQRNDSPNAWERYLLSAFDSKWIGQIKQRDRKVYQAIIGALNRLRYPSGDRGGDYLAQSVSIQYRPDWFLDPRLAADGVCNHAARSHMPQDLHRYLFAACFAQVHGRSPKLHDFPAALLPDHVNATRPGTAMPFADRFRVQLPDRPSTTVVSHIAKDGHYYIHPDPTQCRSLTVREAARLQTFPDNYKFVGNRTEQYHQVGNAVPPLLAHQIAGIVYDLLKRSRLA